MAIQNRRGYYGDFDPEKMVAGEFAFVTSGDPNTSDGQAIYGCFTPGSVKRFATYEDMRAEILNAYAEDLPDMETAAVAANSAADTAASAAQTAQTAAQTATDAADTANAAAQAASEYVLGDISEKTVTFEKDTDRLELESADSTATLFGKLKKWLEDLGAAAFQNVANDLTTEDEGYALDARQGQVLQQQINEIVNFGDCGTEITANANLDSYTTYGRYYSPNSTRTGTLTNKPTGIPSAAFVLEVDTSGAWNRQTIFSGHNTYPYMFVRNFSGSKFSPWYKVTMTAV